MSRVLIFWLVASSVVFASLEAVGDVHIHAAGGEPEAVMSDVETDGDLDCADCACLSGHLFGIELHPVRSEREILGPGLTRYRFSTSNHRAPPVTPPPIALH